eukprot:jgi/Bigna1/77914/fgenesh1_pg.51_\
MGPLQYALLVDDHFLCSMILLKILFCSQSGWSFGMRSSVFFCFCLCLSLNGLGASASCSGKSSESQDICDDGYFLNEDKVTCRDVNECEGEFSKNGTIVEDEHGCSDICNNVCGGYKCSCSGDRLLDEDERNCYEPKCSTDATYTLTIGIEEGETSSDEPILNGESAHKNCSDINGNYTGMIEMTCEKGIMSATNASCEELCEASEWENAPGASCSLTLEMKCDKTNPMEFGQVRQVRQILKGTPGCVETERYHTCTVDKNCPVDCVLRELGRVGANVPLTCGGCGVEKNKRIGTHHAKYGGNLFVKEDLYDFRALYNTIKTCPEDVEAPPSECTPARLRCCLEETQTPSQPDGSSALTKKFFHEASPRIETRRGKGTDFFMGIGGGKREEEVVTITKGSDGAECDETPTMESCKGPPCSETVQIFKNYQCSGEPYPVPTDEAILAEFTVQSIEDNESCITDNEGTFSFDCVRLAQNLTNANQEELKGGRVVFNHQLVNDLPQCCYFKEGKGETLNMYVLVATSGRETALVSMTVTEGVSCLKPVKPSTGGFFGKLLF